MRLEEFLPVHRFCWGNNPRRAELKGRRCVVLAQGRMNTVLVRFIDTGEKVTTSKWALDPGVRKTEGRR